MSTKISQINQTDEDYLAQVGERLRELRTSRNLTQERAAFLVGVTGTTWHRWENGKVAPYEFNWQRISEAFGVDVAEIRGQGFALDEIIGRLDAVEQRLDQLEATDPYPS